MKKACKDGDNVKVSISNELINIGVTNIMVMNIGLTASGKMTIWGTEYMDDYHMG